VFSALSPYRSIQEKHQYAPLRLEREQYLSHLLQQGFDRYVVRSTANYLLHIVRIFELKELRTVQEEEILRAGESWASYEGPHRLRPHVAGASTVFIRVAKAWFLFHGKLARPPSAPFHDLAALFAVDLRYRGLSTATVTGYSSRADMFLRWLASEINDFGAVSIHHVDQFIAVKRTEGWKPRGVATQCQALRSFFRFCEMRGWCDSGIPLGIRSPRIPKYENVPKAPSWPQVQKMVRSIRGLDPVSLRSKAILTLLTIYGLRSSEVTGLRLDDFDWRSETFTVRRAKRGGIQHYPIQYEAGEAILDYLQRGRPKCESRLLFVSARRPYGRLSQSPMYHTVDVAMRKVGINLEHTGPHALRHACATRLLQKGSSLKEIADFLGHKDIKCVGIYARFDLQLMRKVANVSLAGL